MKRAIAAAATLILVAALPARAGFRVEEVDPEFPDDVTTTLFQGGRARVDGALEGLSVIVDLKSQEGWLIDAATKRYAHGKIADLAAQISTYEESQAAEVTRGAQGQAPAARPSAPLAVTVKDLGPGERLQGYETRRYQVLVGGDVVEELWLAPKLEIAREVDLAAFAAATQKMLGGGAGVGQGYEESEAYRTLRAGGYPLRQVLYFVGEKSTLEVRSVAAQELSAAEFEVPKGFAKVGYTELLFGDAD
jgi:hypothetical protein